MKTLSLLLALACAAAASEIVFQTDFEGDPALRGWDAGAGSLVPGQPDGRCLQVVQTQPGGTARCTIAIPAKKLAGQLVTVTARLKAKDVSEPPQHWNGIKVMLMLETGTGRQYPQVPVGHGTLDWQEVRRTLRLPSAATKATLVLGLEKVTGTAWFDDIAIRTGRLVAGGRRYEEPFKGHDLPRLRGVMHGPKFDEKNIRDLKAWGANHVRWQLNWTPMKPAEEWARDLDRYDKWLAGALEDADKAIDACERYNIIVLLDLHCPPGGRAKGGVCRMFTEKRYADKFLAIWDMLARRYKGRSIILAYDLINEPVEPGTGGIVSWRDLATQAARRIRAIDPGKPVLIEPGPWGGPDGFDNLVPLDLDRVIYGFHMYRPHTFTHQFQGKKPVIYPGTIDGERWDKERLREAMLPAIEFQKRFNVHIHLGEFSAIRWAPDGSACRYLRDCIELFEEYGWDWTYHAYREWDGWSVEHGNSEKDRNRSATPTDRQKLLMEHFQKNFKK